MFIDTGATKSDTRKSNRSQNYFDRYVLVYDIRAVLCFCWKSNVGRSSYIICGPDFPYKF